MDIRLDVNFKDHRKRRRLELRLGPEAVLALIDLWISVAETRPRGVLHGMSQEDIAIDAGWKGDIHQFVSTLVDVGLLDWNESEQCYSVHDWDVNQPWVYHADERRKRAVSAAKARWHYQAEESQKPALCVENARTYSRNIVEATPDAGCIENDAGCIENDARRNAREQCSSPSPSPKKSKKTVQSDGSGPAGDPPFVEVILKTGKAYPVTHEQVEEFRELFPNIDVETHLKRIAHWNAVNPARRKTGRGVLRHITSWLQRDDDKAHDQGSRAGGPTYSGPNI